MDSPFFRGNLNLSNYSSFNTSLLHPGMGPPSTPFVPPNHIGSFAPKVCQTIVINIYIKKNMMNIIMKNNRIFKCVFNFLN